LCWGHRHGQMGMIMRSSFAVNAELEEFAEEPELEI
jgi:hypothetical protein